ncbi:MAG: recombination protein RecR [Candidatus Portnoybacteria bacterium RBG_13_40_8]|uniref:Recombination protein RecR n=1 Tax=Candidatus Portnoybacteria bacterium RBG_13_40_8 TaxID=1801990 RepID=A0A1G2F401_9BACT|nr:MAG: recombination protein RecR [Candidatus Portnoybacteria bacterium RBG_13_40_8]OGZ34470.1 MAG: recombination protein RecR [Candidatus Portnoybacteria bacterium RIFCSPHIGHO2_01_FULL_39_19]
MLPRPIQNLIDEFSKLPSVGPRQAARFVFYLINQPKEEIEKFAKKLFILKKIKYCHFCNRTMETDHEKTILCSICKNKDRNRTMVCIVEKDTDIESIEKTKRYDGLYYVIGTEDENKQLARLKDLISRIKKSNKELKEIIIATDATTEGETIALYAARQLAELNKIYPELKITRLGRGLSTGSELEYMDEDTLTNALLGRK